MSDDQLIYSVVTRSALLPDLRSAGIYRYRARITARRVIFSIDGPDSESGTVTLSLFHDNREISFTFSRILKYWACSQITIIHLGEHDPEKKAL